MSFISKLIRNRVLFRRYFQRYNQINRKCYETNSSDSSPEDKHFNKRIISLYDSHIPTSFTQKVVLSVGSAISAITDPYRDDMVAVFGETTGHLALRRVYQNMANDSEGKQIIADNPRISSKTIDIEMLSTLPEETFGRHYYHFLKNNDVTPDSRRSVHFVDDMDLAQVMQRYREIHDMIHTLLAMPTNMLGEVVVKWVEAIQTDLPMCWLGGLFGAVRLAPKQRKNYVQTYLPWALKCGHESKLLMNVYFEKRFQQNIEDLRKELRIPPIPHIS